MQATVSLITQNAFYVIYLPLIMTQQIAVAQPVEVAQPVVECVSSDDAQYRIYLPLIVNQVAAERPQQPDQYHVYLPLIMNQTVDRSSECPHRVYLPIIMNQPAEPTSAPTPTATPPATVPATATPTVTPTSTPSEYRVYLPLILKPLQFRRGDIPLPDLLQYGNSDKDVGTEASPVALVVSTPVPAVKGPATPEGYFNRDVQIQLRSRLNNHKRGTTVVTACGHMSEVRIEFAHLYPDASVEVEYEQQGMKYAERYPLTGAPIMVDSKEHVRVKLTYLRDGQQITVVAPPTTTNTSEIPDDVLMQAGFCGGSSNCQDFKANNICRGKFSWDIWFM